MALDPKNVERYAVNAALGVFFVAWFKAATTWNLSIDWIALPPTLLAVFARPAVGRAFVTATAGVVSRLPRFARRISAPTADRDAEAQVA